MKNRLFRRKKYLRKKKTRKTIPQFFFLFWKTKFLLFYSILKKKKYSGLILVGGDFFWLDKFLLAWIKMLNVQSQFSPTPLYVLTQFQDWELGLSFNFKIAHQFCAIFWKLPNSGGLPNFGSQRQLCNTRHCTLHIAHFVLNNAHCTLHIVH